MEDVSQEKDLVNSDRKLADRKRASIARLINLEECENRKRPRPGTLLNMRALTFEDCVEIGSGNTSPSSIQRSMSRESAVKEQVQQKAVKQLENKQHQEHSDQQCRKKPQAQQTQHHGKCLEENRGA